MKGDYLNEGRLTAMRWSYAAIILFFCCVDESRTFFVVASVAHILIFAIRFLNRDVTHHASIIQKAAIIEKDLFAQACYDAELEKQKPCWFEQFNVYNFETVPVAPVFNGF